CVALKRDPIRIYASLLRAQLTGDWVGKTSADPVVKFDAGSFLQFSAWYGDYLRTLYNNRNDPNLLQVRYEDLSDPSVVNSILEHIGSKANHKQLKSEYQKQSSRINIEDAFSNPDDVLKVMNMVGIPEILREEIDLRYPLMRP